MIKASLRRPAVVDFNQAEPSIILVPPAGSECKGRAAKVAAFGTKGLIKTIGLKASGVGLRTRRTGEGESVNVHPGTGHGLICSHAETQLDGLPIHVRSHVYHRVDVATRITAPYHSSLYGRNHRWGGPTRLAQDRVASSHKTTSNT